MAIGFEGEFAIALFEPEQDCIGHIVSLSCDCAKTACDGWLEDISFVCGVMIGFAYAIEDQFAPSPYRLTLKNCLGIANFLLEQSDKAQPHQGVHKITESAQSRMPGHPLTLQKRGRVSRDMDRRTGDSEQSVAETQRNEYETAV